MSGQRGEMSLVGLMVAAVLSGTVAVCTLSLFATFERTAQASASRNASQDDLRTASDLLARVLRNLASPTADQPQAIDRAGSQDLVVQSVDPSGPNAGTNTTNVRRQRFCLDTSSQLWQQTQTWTTATPPTMPSTTACPGTGWPAGRVLTDGVTNTTTNTAVFTYDSTTLTDITRVGIELRSTPSATNLPIALRTGVFLRNQNQRPVASFTATPSAKGIVLNGSASFDPEGQPLDFAWYDGSTLIGSGITLTWLVSVGSVHQLKLVASDPAGLQSVTAVQTVTA